MIGTHKIYTSQEMTIAYSSLDMLIATSLPLPTCIIDIPAIPYFSSTHDTNIGDKYNTSTIYAAYKYVISN